jgi:ring-1,2-phenylacetyl-CoA epoxidase subunit PaaC
MSASLSSIAPETRDAALFEYALRLGDDSLINFALDLVGQAILFLDIAGTAEGKDRDADRLAFHRDVLAFRNCLLVEQPNGDFARTMARQFLFSTMQVALFDALARSAGPRLAEIAAKAVKEVRYHAELSADWVIRLGDGTDESHERMVDGFDWCWRFVEEMFDMDETELALAAQGIAVDRATLRAGFDARVEEVLREATLPLPTYPRAVRGGRIGHHSEHLGHLLAPMQYLPRTYPDAVW